jgi:hypothetical protein
MKAPQDRNAGLLACLCLMRSQPALREARLEAPGIAQAKAPAPPLRERKKDLLQSALGEPRSRAKLRKGTLADNLPATQ